MLGVCNSFCLKPVRVCDPALGTGSDRHEGEGFTYVAVGVTGLTEGQTSCYVRASDQK